MHQVLVCHLLLSLLPFYFEGCYWDNTNHDQEYNTRDFRPLLVQEEEGSAKEEERNSNAEVETSCKLWLHIHKGNDFHETADAADKKPPPLRLAAMLSGSVILWRHARFVRCTARLYPSPSIQVRCRSSRPTPRTPCEGWKSSSCQNL